MGSSFTISNFENSSSLYSPKSKSEIIQMAVDKTNKEMDVDKYKRNNRLLNTAFWGTTVGGMLMYNGAASTTLAAGTYGLPFLGLLGLDKIISKHSEKYKKFKSDHPGVSFIGLVASSIGLSHLISRNFLAKNNRAETYFEKINNFYNKVGNFLKENPVSKKVKELYSKNFPVNGQRFFTNLGDKASNLFRSLKSNKIFGTAVGVIPGVLLVMDFIRRDNFRAERNQRLKDNYIELSKLNDAGQL